MEHSGGSENHDNELLDHIIKRIMTAPMAKRSTSLDAPLVDVAITRDEVRHVTNLASESLMEQHALLRVDESLLPAVIVGDLHGQLRDLRIILKRVGDPAVQTYIFLGDYVDRGLQGLETAILLMCLKIRHPNRMYLLRGNHEDISTTSTYGFYDECLQKYGRDGQNVWLEMMTAFNCLPASAVVAERVFCLHGGLSPFMKNINEIDDIVRPTVIPPYGLLCDLVWSDPDPAQRRGWSLSSRGISVSFDDRIVENFCSQNGVDVIVRAHQITTEMFRSGYKVTCGGRLITLFSAPNYLNMMNDSAVLRVDENLTLRFIVFRPNRSANTARIVEDAASQELNAML